MSHSLMPAYLYTHLTEHGSSLEGPSPDPAFFAESTPGIIITSTEHDELEECQPVLRYVHFSST